VCIERDTPTKQPKSESKVIFERGAGKGKHHVIKTCGGVDV
jgi:hypothetical protein